MERCWAKVLLTLLIIWVGVSAYFYTQHIVTVWKYDINRSVVNEDIRIVIDHMLIEDYKYDYDKYFNSIDWFFKISSRTPVNIVKPLYTFTTFYISPYEFDRNFLHTKLRVKLVSDKFIGEPDISNAVNNFDIYFVDNSGKSYSISRSFTKNSNSNVVAVEFKGNGFPASRMNEALTIIIKDKGNNTTQKIEIKPEFVKMKFNFFRTNPHYHYK